MPNDSNLVYPASATTSPVPTPFVIEKNVVEEHSDDSFWRSAKYEKKGFAKIDSLVYTPVEGLLQDLLGRLSEGCIKTLYKGKINVAVAVCYVLGVLLTVVAYFWIEQEFDFGRQWYNEWSRSTMYLQHYVNNYHGSTYFSAQGDAAAIVKFVQVG